MILCEYGCGQEATHQFKNGKWCCSKTILSCPQIRQSQKGEKHPRIGKTNSVESKNRMRESHLGKPGFWKGKEREKETRQKISRSLKGRTVSDIIRIKMKTSIIDICSNYPLFSKIEELRYNPNSYGEIQAHCRNSSCQNSKEKNGWFTPTYSQLYERIRQIEYGNGGSYLYCSEKCKRSCPLFNLKSDPNKDNELPYTQEECSIWRQTVLEQDNYMCQICESEKDLHCHHIEPVKTHPHLALDPSNGIVLCQTCHYKYGHNGECSTGNLATIICNKRTKN